MISGFLITGLLLKEFSQSGTISIASFYARRVRRLLPALLLVILVTLVLSAWLLPVSGECQSLAWSAVSALLFSSNFFFWRTRTGYFAEDADSLPLLHTWTLAVEEQFYIIWPVLIIVVLIVIRKYQWRKILVLGAMFAAIILLSFLVSYWLTYHRGTAAFFLLPARAWELASGALLALVLQSRSIDAKRYGDFLIWMGLICLAVSFVIFDGETRWPGHSAILPVAGTLAIIAEGSMSPAGWGVRVLSTAPMVYIGRLSYSWVLVALAIAGSSYRNNVG